MNFWQKNNCQFDKNAILQRNIYDNWFTKYDCQICWLLVVVWPHPCLSLIWIETIKSIYFFTPASAPSVTSGFDYKNSTYQHILWKSIKKSVKLGGLNNYKFLYFKAIQFKNETIFTYFCFSNTWALSQSHHTLTGCAVTLVLLRLAEDFKGLWLFEKRPLSMSHFHFLTSSFLTILKTHWIMLFIYCFLSLQFWRVFLRYFQLTDASDLERWINLP